MGEEVAALLGEVLHEGPGLCGRYAVPTSGEHAQHYLLLLPEHPVIVPGIEEAGLVPLGPSPTSSAMHGHAHLLTEAIFCAIEHQDLPPWLRVGHWPESRRATPLT